MRMRLNFSRKNVLILILIIFSTTYIVYVFGGVEQLNFYYNKVNIFIQAGESFPDLAGSEIKFISNGDLLKSKELKYREDEEPEKGYYANFTRRQHGKNIFEMTVSEDCTEKFGEKIVVRFGHLNTNKSYVNNYDIHIKIEEISDYQAFVTITQELIVEATYDVLTETRESKLVTPGNNIVELYHQ